MNQAVHERMKTGRSGGQLGSVGASLGLTFPITLLGRADEVIE